MTGTSIGTLTERARKPRERMSWHRYAQMFRTDNPELFDPYDKITIRDAMMDKGVPPTVIEDLLDMALGLDRADLDPRHEKKRKPTKSPEARAAAREAAEAEREKIIAETKARAERIAVRKIGPDMIMDDGRRLGDWTVGELRKLNGLFSFILDKAGTDDDKRTVDKVMKARDWKAASKA